MAIGPDFLNRATDDELLFHIGQCARAYIKNSSYDFYEEFYEDEQEIERKELDSEQFEKLKWDGIKEARRRGVHLVSNDLGDGWYVYNDKDGRFCSVIGGGMVNRTLREAWITWVAMDKPAQTYGMRICRLTALDEQKGRGPVSADSVLYRLGKLRAVKRPTKAQQAEMALLLKGALKSGVLLRPRTPLSTWRLTGEPGLLQQPDGKRGLQFSDLEACWQYWRGMGRPYGTAAQQRINMHTYERSGMDWHIEE